MKKFLIVLVVIAILNAPLFAQGGQGDDPGILDSIIIECDSLIIGRSMPVTIRVVNDFATRTILTRFNLESINGASIVFDSVRYLNRLLDPSIFNIRSCGEYNYYSPNNIQVALDSYTNHLPPGNDAIVEFYFTGLTPGIISIDSAHLEPTFDFIFSSQLPESYVIFEPQFQKVKIPIVVGTPFPEIIIDNNNTTVIAEEKTSSNIIITSPLNFPTTLNIKRFSKFDNNTETTLNSPKITENDKNIFEWTPSLADIGIWEAIIEGCDSSSTCVEGSIIIQVLESDDFLVDFTKKSISNFHQPQEMLWENLDDDPYPEILTVGYQVDLKTTFATYDFEYNNYTTDLKFMSPPPTYPHFTLALGYIDSDEILDAIYPSTLPQPSINVLSGLRGSQFDNENSYITVSSELVTRNAVLNDFNRDKFLDYAVSGIQSVIIFKGLGSGYFEEMFKIELSEKVRSLNTADFNGDNKNDLAIGTDAGVYIYHNRGNETFSFIEFHPQSYGTVDIDITNDGSDFNDDRYFDFVITSPSVGGEFSEIVLYQGKPNGTFDVVPVRTLKGQVFGNSIADFNDDNNLDIAFVNSAFKYIGILYGDGDGNFVNEQRYYISDIPLFTINCVDFDLDGDVDISSVGTDNVEDGTLFLLENTDNTLIANSKSFELEVLNNANMQMTSPAGKVMNNVSSSFSASSIYLKSIDDNTHIDKVYSLKTVEDGAYRIEVDPKIDVPIGEPFSIEFKLDNEQFSLAKDIPMSKDGYTFVVYPSGISPVNPIPGQFTGDKSPLFAWDMSGDVNFQLASDIDFTNIIHESIVSTQHIKYTSELPTNDTTSYYWRVKQISNPNYDAVYVFNLFDKVPTGLDDGDMNLPSQFALAQNYPNPFNPTTQLSFSLPEKSLVTMNIFNIAGQKIKTLANREFSAGIHTVEWDGTNASGSKAATGIYLMKLTTDKNFSKSIKMLMMK